MKIVRITAGFALLLIAIVIGPVPGPWSIPLVIVALSILAIDFVWARRLKRRLRDQAQKVVNAARGKN